MNYPASSRWLQRFAWLTAATTLALIGIGGLVTSHGAGMAVPDWPTTYGYNMFFFPISKWIGGIFYEHTHRLVASVVGLLVVALTRWLGGRPARLPLAVIGLAEVLAGIALLKLDPSWSGAGHFLSGIGGVVLMGAAVWVRNQPTARPLPLLGWLAFASVQVQGLLGGLRVVLFKDELGIVHAALAQSFFVMLCIIAVLTSRRWTADKEDKSIGRPAWLGYLFLATTILIFLQLTLGATMRHQHAGLAIRDFPLAYGKLWPAMDPESVRLYNQHRIETTADNPITAFQIGLQMVHRIVALLILGAVAICAWGAVRRQGVSSGAGRLALAWLGLVLTQALLGAATIWSGKAADVATAHVLVGALSLAFGAIGCMLLLRSMSTKRQNVLVAAVNQTASPAAFGAPATAR
jgi:cytochrome c oxidase assembly protein subunit 15